MNEVMEENKFLNIIAVIFLGIFAVMTFAAYPHPSPKNVNQSIAKVWRNAHDQDDSQPDEFLLESTKGSN